jgi:hypothetical protein
MAHCQKGENGKSRSCLESCFHYKKIPMPAKVNLIPDIKKVKFVLMMEITIFVVNQISDK